MLTSSTEDPQEFEEAFRLFDWRAYNERWDVSHVAGGAALLDSGSAGGEHPRRAAGRGATPCCPAAPAHKPPPTPARPPTAARYPGVPRRQRRAWWPGVPPS